MIPLLSGFLVLQPMILDAGEGRGESLLWPFSSAQSIGRGGNAVASEGVSMFVANPASVGRTGKTSFNAEYYSLDGNPINPSINIAIPTSFGVIGVSSDYYVTSEPGDDKTVAGRALAGGARELYPGFLIGVSLYTATIEMNGDGSFYGGIQLGSIFNFITGVGGVNGLGLHELSLGASMRVGHGEGDDEMIKSHDQLLAGYSLLFFRHPVLNLRLYNEAGSLWEIDRYFITTGLEMEYRETLLLRTGLIAPFGYRYSGVTAGIGIMFNTADLCGSLDYAWVYNPDYGTTHCLGITVTLDSPDSRPPLTEVMASFNGFSPNSDAVQDYMIFKLLVRDESDIRGWRFQILDSQGRVIKEFRHHRRERKGWLPPRDLFGGRESGVVPPMITWDGIDDNGKVFSDGDYYYAFTVWDTFDNITPARKGHLIIDTAKPEVSVRALSSRLNPASGGTIEIEQKIGDRNNDLVTVELMDENGDAVRRYSWRAVEVPALLSWNGLNEEGKPAENGFYTYKISVKDLSGNGVIREINNLIVENRDYLIDISASGDYYSPSLGGPLIFKTQTEKIQDPKNWKLHITDAGGRDVQVLNGSGAPLLIEWDGLTEVGRRMHDGRYLYYFQVFRKDGSSVESPKKQIKMASSLPRIRLSPGRSVFSPDGDFNDDLVELSVKAGASSGTAKWELNFYSGSGGLYYKKSGENGVPAEILWGGRGLDGSLPFSMENFSVELVVYDRAGNRSISRKSEISTNVMVVPRKDTLRITFADTTNPEIFHSDRRFNSILGRIVDVLASYPDYRIDIEAHTDFEGDDHHNLIVSEKKAKYIKDFLHGKGMVEREMSFRGMGETNPLFGQDSGGDRGKNNRVEIILSPRVY